MAATAGIEPRAHAAAPSSSRPAPTTCHVAFIGDVVGIRARRLEAELLAGARSADRVVVNLSRVRHLDVVTMQALVRARRMTEARSAQFEVQGLSRAATEALARAGVRWKTRVQ